jgi:hypothetical protein
MHPVMRAMVVAALLVGVAAIVRGQGAASDEFFIVSSVNPVKQQVIAKRPTEVTQVIFVDSSTKYVDRSGAAITLGDLRAGDTVYIRERRDSNRSVAAEIRKGPMTLNELKKRYLSSSR